MRFIVHFAHVHPNAYWTVSGILIAAGLALSIVLPRRNRKKIVALLDLFDPGTSEFEATAGEYVVRGHFHGRPASVSARRKLMSRIEVCVAGRFYLPFKAQTSRWHWVYRIQMAMDSLGLLLWILLWTFQGVYEGSFIGKFMLVLVALVVGAGVTLYCIGKLAGYFEETSPSVFGVDLGGMGLRPFATYQPDRFRAAIEHPEIRESFAHFFGSCHADMLKVPGRVRLNAKDQKNWTFAVEATWLSRDSSLNKETVNKALTELSTLCTDLDRFASDPMLSWLRA